MKFSKLIWSSVLVWLAGTAFVWLTCGWLFSWIYEIPPLIWHLPEVIMGATNTIISLAIGLVGAFAFVWVYAILFKGIPGKGVRKGLMYGLLLWLACVLFGMITMPLYMTISWWVVVYWVLQALVISLAKGAIVGAMYKK